MDPSRIDVRSRGHLHVIALSGEHDLSTADALRAAIEGGFDAGSRVILDLTAATFIDSTVIHAIIRGHDRAIRDPADEFGVVAPPGGFAYRVLALTEISRIVPTFATLDEALSQAS
jgi:anti-sigma B factor antagonist